MPMLKRLCLYLVTLSIIIHSGCVIIGRVVDENGTGIEGMSVRLYNGTSSIYTKTESNGYYQFGNLDQDNMLPAGNYTVYTDEGREFASNPPRRSFTMTTKKIDKLGTVVMPAIDMDFVITDGYATLWVSNYAEIPLKIYLDDVFIGEFSDYYEEYKISIGYHTVKVCSKKYGCVSQSKFANGRNTWVVGVDLK